MPLPLAERITYAQYRQLPDDGKRYEVIDGELYVTPSPVWTHQRISFWITCLIGGWIEQNGLGCLQSAPLDVILSDDTIVQPDHLFIRKERVPTIVGQWVHGQPDLAIEILSPSTAGRDQVVKRSAYARHGISEYWIVDPETRSVTVLVLKGKHYAKLGSVCGDRFISSSVLSGLPVHAADLFRD
ncbi:MAG: Uma2 family endonuclease [Candidatus Riflebacteria bacterium]|nr:Uma2 family endonuclease [Candidatus Riflebacteria bacterium]